MTEDIPESSGKVAKKLGVSGQTVRNLLASGKLQGSRLPSGEWRVRPSALDKFLESLRSSGE